MKDKTQITSLKLRSNSLRILSADAIERAKSGHPGLPLGFSDVFTILVSLFLKYNPRDPLWAARDRLVLSAGHGSMLLYSFLHFVGYKGYEMDQIMKFRQMDSRTPGHPEYNPEFGIETTTGPLGQGFANSVGMAIAQKKYESRLGELMQYKIYCICGDGCLMEGISYESASIAGHLGLNNLVLLFDDNNISIDGSTSLATSDDHCAKFISLGWNVYKTDGHDFDKIIDVMEKVKNSDKPSFISFRTKIGYGSSKENSESSHGSPLGKDAISILRKNLNWQAEPFEFPENIYDDWKEILAKNELIYEKWQKKYTQLSNEEKSYLSPVDKDKIREGIAVYTNKVNDDESTRVSSGKIVELIQKFSDKVIVGSADLASSNSLYNKYTKPITRDDFTGNFIHYGVRENAMAAIMNGLATQNFLPIGGTFLVFSDYMRPSIRLSAIMNLPVIYIMTHDSIGVGEDGPTHQPVEHISSFRAMPNINLFRPCDMQEVETCFDSALSSNSPSMMILTRQKIPNFASSVARRDNIRSGAYILEKDSENPDISIWASGSEVQIAKNVKRILSNIGITVSVISVPNLGLFFKQNDSYKLSLLDHAKKFNCVIEASSKVGWESITGRNGLFFGMNEFGKSAPYEELYKYFKIYSYSIVEEVLKQLQRNKI